MMADKIEIVCSVCGSYDVRRDADATWNVEKQEWELIAVYDNATCEHCGKETTLQEIGIN
jgi:DNA-directed RNA polymerase subunit RPC12/RpoP